MWWIAACLGALVWLLWIRIKLKDQSRLGRSRQGLLAGRVGSDEEAEAKQRSEFLKQGFLPAAERYLKEEPELNSVLLLLACFLDEHGGPDAVHGEVLPCTQLAPVWPDAARYSPVVQEEDGELVMAPSQAHWQKLAALDPWRASLPAFATRLRPMAPSTPFLEAYRPYALVKRTDTGFELQVFDQPADVPPSATDPR